MNKVEKIRILTNLLLAEESAPLIEKPPVYTLNENKQTIIELNTLLERLTDLVAFHGIIAWNHPKALVLNRFGLCYYEHEHSRPHSYRDLFDAVSSGWPLGEIVNSVHVRLLALARGTH